MPTATSSVFAVFLDEDLEWNSNEHNERKKSHPLCLFLDTTNTPDYFEFHSLERIKHFYYMRASNVSRGSSSLLTEQMNPFLLLLPFLFFVFVPCLKLNVENAYM